MVEPASLHPLQVAFVRTARAVPRGARVARELPVLDTCMALLREFSGDDAPVALAFGDGAPSVVRRAGDAWYASYGAVGRQPAPGPHDMGWLVRTCGRADGPHPFDGMSRSWGVTSYPDYARALPEDAFKEVDAATGDRLEAIRGCVASIVLVDGEVLREVRDPVLECDGPGLVVHLFDAGDTPGSFDGIPPDEALLARAPHRMFSLGDLSAIEAIHGAMAFEAPGFRVGPAPAPPSLASRAAARHLDHLYAVMRGMVADGDETHFAAYRRLRETVSDLGAADIEDPGVMADMVAAVLDAEAAVEASHGRWSTRPGRIIAARLRMARPDLSLAGFVPG